MQFPNKVVWVEKPGWPIVHVTDDGWLAINVSQEPKFLAMSVDQRLAVERLAGWICDFFRRVQDAEAYQASLASPPPQPHPTGFNPSNEVELH